MSDWHEDGTRAFICRCVDGEHLVKDWVHLGRPSDREIVLSDHAKAALLGEAVKALEPFAQLAMPGREGLPDDRKYLVVDNTWLTLGDFRRATAILTRLRDVPVHDTKGE